MAKAPKSMTVVAAILATMTLPAPGHTQAADPVRYIEVSEALHTILERRLLRERALLWTPVYSPDAFGDHPDAVSLKEIMLQDGLVDANEKALLRAIFSGQRRLAVQHGNERFEVGAIRYSSALSELLPLFSDFHCATTYVLFAAFNPEDRERSLQRANGALDRHLQANPGVQRTDAEGQLTAAWQARAQRIQQGAEPVVDATADYVACQRKYGHS